MGVCIATGVTLGSEPAGLTEDNEVIEDTYELTSALRFVLFVCVFFIKLLLIVVFQ